MAIFAQVLGDNPVKLWGLTSAERLRRQFRQLRDVNPIDDSYHLPDDALLLVVHSDYVVELHTLKQLLSRPDVVLRSPADQRLAAVFVPASKASQALALLNGSNTESPADLDIVEPATLGGYNETLLRSEPPMLEQVSTANRADIEDRLYGSSYKGITDLVTKWLWPRPAKKGVHLCAALGITPNFVTASGFLLMLAACGFFYQGQFVAGLAAGWFMTYLDTVDGKLARVTVQSSKLGHVLDHGMDIIHPPFWYVLWGMALVDMPTPFGLGTVEMCWLIVTGYWLGRIAEQSFVFLGGGSMFAWRPFDAYFRLVTARRNPCLIILTAGCLLSRPDWGFIGITLWTVATTVVLIVRLLQGSVERVLNGAIRSWLADRTAVSRYPKTYRIFAATRGAYAPG